jgi:ubiquinone/menaquinone biosynthesis C-methylase UbiE
MDGEAAYENRWVALPAEELARYDEMFAWNPASAPLYASADVQAGQTVADFGCGPGHMAVEFAGWVGPAGHVHALDINPEFVALARERTASKGLSGRITVHQSDGASLPLADGALDRILARNTIIYVDDPLACLAEMRRALVTGGKAHMIEGDWPMMVVEPVPTRAWADLIAAAASHACRTPDIGRKLQVIARRAGFSAVALEVVTRPDTDGRLLPMIRNLGEFARESGRIEVGRVDATLAIIEAALADGTYLALAPQFVVTATV